MTAFVVRPFGVKDGIDFDRVHRELLDPVFKQFGIEAQTTGAFAQAGNIRADMFERLMLADLVVADVSIHNANVYYELGVRHALRDRKTILIRSRIDEVPFDLRTDRYVEYPKDDPAAARAAFTEAVFQTLHSDSADSPVFLLVPNLNPQNPESLVPVPPLFLEAVRKAEATADRARLHLFAEEVASLDWAVSAWRVVGRAQMSLQDFSSARTTFEGIRARNPNDVEVNLLLATIYQRLGDLAASSAAVERALAVDGLQPKQRAEAKALHASNVKARWASEWRAVPIDRRAWTAISSGLLRDAAREYEEAFSEDQNHYYSGLNALALTTVTRELAKVAPDGWACRFDSDEAAQAGLTSLEAARRRLEAAVRQSIDAATYRARAATEPDVWRELTNADFALLVSNRPAFVARSFSDACRLFPQTGGAGTRFPAESAARQLRLYLELGVLVDNSRAALSGLGLAERPADVSPTVPRRVVVFTGHRLDGPDRPKARFPASKVPQVRAAILAQLEQERREATGSIEGIAGGASGGDILFHEVCAELNIPTSLLLAIPVNPYIVASVQDAGAEWVDRFRALYRRVPPQVLGENDVLPPWLVNIHGYDVWQRNNLWTLSTALSRDNAEVSLMQVWDGQQGDGPGGTADMVKLARARGVKVLSRIDPLTA